MIDTQALRAEKQWHAAEIIHYDNFLVDPLAFIADADVCFEQEGAVTRVAIAILRYLSLELVEYIRSPALLLPCPIFLVSCRFANSPRY